MRATGRMVAGLLALCLPIWVGASADAPAQRSEQVAAFARLYGVVRYFYPGDTAQTIDWNRFAIAGVDDAQQARNSVELKKKLDALFEPLGPGIDIVPVSASFTAPHVDATKQPLVAWRYLGFSSGSAKSAYAAARTGRAGAGGFVGLASVLDATALHGKTIRLRGSIRALGPSTTKGLGLWLRIDRKGQSPGFFENTGDRQKPDLAWHDYDISTRVGADASQLAFGVSLILPQNTKDPAAAFRDITLEVSDGHGNWQPVAIPALRDAGNPKGPWHRVGNIGTNATTATWHAAKDGAGYLVLQNHGNPGESVLFDAPPVAGKAVEFPLGAGLKARVALTLTDAQARASQDRAAALAALGKRLAALPAADTSGAASKAVREAGIVVTWSVLRHFYPYWDVIHVDWDRALRPALDDAGNATTRTAWKSALQRLLAPLEDAHITVIDMAAPRPASLPIALAPIEGQWVIVATTVPEQAKVGDVVTSIDGTPMPQAREQAEALVSGQPSSRSWKALQYLQWEPAAVSHAFGLKHADGSTSTVSLAHTATKMPAPTRPAPIAELKPGVWYVDVARTDLQMFATNMTKLANAHAVIYDVRGYPKDFHLSTAIPAHLLKHAENAKWMHVPRYTGPFGERAGYQDAGWGIQPATPHFTSRAIFLVDGGTISQAEAIMGYVQDEKLGTIVGTTTRGVDGDVAMFDAPGKFRVLFTGMKVTHHDGVSRYHALGTRPDVTVAPTIAGVRAGRDEVLDAALKMAR